MPDSVSSADTLAYAYYKKGIYDMSIDLLEDAIKKVPNNATCQYHLGLAYEKSNKRAEATAHLKRAVEIAPNSSIANDARRALEGVGKG
jgi:tetratricopeptide (TPR) repeat protein